MIGKWILNDDRSISNVFLMIIALVNNIMKPNEVTGQLPRTLLFHIHILQICGI
jgi:hypothetical protein